MFILHLTNNSGIRELQNKINVFYFKMENIITYRTTFLLFFCCCFFQVVGPWYFNILGLLAFKDSKATKVHKLFFSTTIFPKILLSFVQKIAKQLCIAKQIAKGITEYWFTIIIKPMLKTAKIKNITQKLFNERILKLLIETQSRSSNPAILR